MAQTAAQKKAAEEKAAAEAAAATPEVHRLYSPHYPELKVTLDGKSYAAEFSANVFETEDAELAEKLEGTEGIVRIAK